MTQKQHLAIVLQQIAKRYSSIFFSKLVLLEDKQEDGQNFIRHYDIQCEAATSLFDTLSTKLKAIKLRAFHFMKFYNKDAPLRTKTQIHSHSFVHNNPVNSFYGSRKNHNNSFIQQRNFPKTSRYHMHQRSLVNGGFSQIDSDISSLMGKMKEINSKIPQFGRTNNQNTEVEKKYNKRKLIMSKLAELQNDLSLLDQEQGDRKNMSNVNVPVHHNLVEKTNTKSVRSFNNTFSYKKNQIY